MAKSPVLKMKPFTMSASKAKTTTSGLGAPASAAPKPPGGGSAGGLGTGLPATNVSTNNPYSPGVSGVLDQQRANIRAALKSTLGSITQAEDRGANDFGFAVKYAPQVGENGERTVTSVAVDPSNPFSRAALLQRSYDNAKRGSTNSYASSGQLYSGALQNAQNENARGFQQGDSALRQAFSDFILSNEAKRAQAVQSANEGDAQAQLSALQQQLAMDPTDPGSPDPGVVAGSPANTMLRTSTPDNRVVVSAKKSAKKKKIVANNFVQTGSVK